MSKLQAFLRDESGASAAEYALILAIVGLGIFIALNFLQGAISTAVNKAGNCINSPSSSSCQ